MSMSISGGYECEFFKVTPDELVMYEDAYPGVPVEVELKKMRVWLASNPDRPKKKFKRFIANWLAATHGRLLEVHTMAQTRESMRWEKDRAKALVGKWSGYK